MPRRYPMATPRLRCPLPRTSPRRRNPVNPMTLDLPTGRQLDEDEMPAFFAERDRILAVRDAAANAAQSEQPVMASAGDGGAQ